MKTNPARSALASLWPQAYLELSWQALFQGSWFRIVLLSTEISDVGLGASKATVVVLSYDIQHHESCSRLFPNLLPAIWLLIKHVLGIISNMDPCIPKPTVGSFRASEG